MNHCFLEKLQHAIEIKLNTFPDFQNIPVISHRIDDMDATLDELVHSGTGLCVIIMNPLPTKIIPGKYSVAFETLHLRIQIIDAGCFAKKDFSPITLAEKITQILHNFKPTLPHWSGWLSIDTHKPWRELKDPENLGRYILELSFYANGSTLNFSNDFSDENYTQ